MFNDRIGLRMHGRTVQRVLAILNSQKTRRLLECLFPESLDIAKLRSRPERAVLVTIRDDALRQFVADPGYVLQKVSRSGVEVDADAVHTRFHSGGKTAFELSLVHVVLILPHSNGLWLRFDQFRQRVL